MNDCQTLRNLVPMKISGEYEYDDSENMVVADEYVDYCDDDNEDKIDYFFFHILILIF